MSFTNYNKDNDTLEEETLEATIESRIEHIKGLLSESNAARRALLKKKLHKTKNNKVYRNFSSAGREAQTEEELDDIGADGSPTPSPAAISDIQRDDQANLAKGVPAPKGKDK